VDGNCVAGMFFCKGDRKAEAEVDASLLIPFRQFFCGCNCRTSAPVPVDDDQYSMTVKVNYD